MVQDKSIPEPEKDSQTKQQPPLCNMAAKPSSGMAMGANTNPFCQPQSQFGPVGAAAVAVAAHRNVGAVQYGLT